MSRRPRFIRWILVAAAVALVLGACSQTRIDPASEDTEAQPLETLANAPLVALAWEDVDRDGRMELGEPAMAGVSVELLDAKAASFDPAVVGVTGDDGRYTFQDLAAGIYHLAFSRPDGYEFTRPDGGDSDASLLTGVAGPIELGGATLATQAVEPGSASAGLSVAPILVTGNPSCALLNVDEELFPEVTSDFGFKVEGDYNRTVAMDGTASGTTLTGGAPSDSTNQITLSSADGLYLDWAATLGMDAVIVKASADANAYVYSPEAFADSGLHGPINPNTGLPYAISHVEFCYDYALTAEKTATPSYTRTYAWTIAKTVDPASHVGWAGEAFSWDYDVTLDRTVTDHDFAVSGEILVTNPTPFAVEIDVADTLDGVAATVACPTTTLAAGESVTCTYTAALAAKTDGTNTATVTSADPYVAGATATAAYAFGDPTTIEGYEAVNVTDYFDGATEGEALGAAGDDITFSYDYGADCPTDADFYEDGVLHRTYPNYAEIDETGQQDDASVELTCYIPTVSKTATATYVERHDWSVAKSVAPEAQSGFLGDTLGWTWTIDVTETVVDQEFLVTGTISVTNPSPESVDATVEDVYEAVGAIVTVDCDAATEGDQSTLTIPATSTGTCTYVVEAPDASAMVNTASVTLAGYEYVATADVTFEKIVENDSATLSDPGLEIVDVAVSGDYSTTIDRDHVCSSELASYDASGSYTATVENTATLVDAEGTPYTATDGTIYACYVPTIEKTAAGTYDERHEWSVEKTVVPASQAAFFGDTVYFDWTITVGEEVFAENFGVAGTITVSNPNPEDALVVPLADLVGGVAATIDATTCAFDGTHLTVAPGSSQTCGYGVALAADTTVADAPTVNTATIVLNGVSFDATAGIAYTPTVIRGTATLDDARFDLSGEAVDDGWTMEVRDGYTCSTDEADYANGVDADNVVSNTAEVYSDDVLQDSSTATTEIDCYAPVVSKDATATYVERHTWDVEKSVSPLDQWGYPGDELDWTWTVTVGESFVEEDFRVSGDIRVSNPSGAPEAIEVSVFDELNDGTAAVPDCGGGTNVVSVAPGATATCSYLVQPSGRTATSNTARVAFNGQFFDAVAGVTFEATVLNGTATLVDDQIGLSESLAAGAGSWSFDGDGSHVCSASYADYGEDGTYSATLDNTATVTASDGQSDSASASTTYTCEAGTLTVLKLTNGMETVSQTWRFEVYEGPLGFGSIALHSDATPPALIDFGVPALRLDTTYTLCELEVPAGYSTFWQLDGVTVLPYNPNAADDPPEDLGNRCFDFAPSYAGAELTFVVDNQMPGGAPRTPGYWKNWNTCTGGGQQYTAAANGGWEEGFWLLEDVLDPSIGGGIVWDDILDDTLFFEIADCQDAVNILDKRDLDGKKLASDPFHNLATSLLAAQLNFGAGACTTQDVNDAALEAETLLDRVDFDGYGYEVTGNIKKSPDAALANQLAGYLDLYNNGEFCGDGLE